MTTKKTLKRIIDVAAGREKADLAIINANVVDVFNHAIIKNAAVLVANGVIAGVRTEGELCADQIIDAKGEYVMPGFINGHVHIESSHLCPEMFASAVVPHGTTTVIADPHEICNVCGIEGLDYFYKATENIPLSVFFMVPSCVPATPFEHAGAVLGAKEIEKCINLDRVLGLGELMNYVGTSLGDDEILDKIMVANKAGKPIDGHSPNIHGETLDAYVAAGPFTDHECATPEELRERTSRGMYVLLRQGSACHDTERLAKGVDDYNARLCMFCTDDRQPNSIYKEGDINNNIRLGVKGGINEITAIQIATINAATAHHLTDRGAIAPGKRADIVIAPSLEYPLPSKVIINGKLVAENGKYLEEVKPYIPKSVSGKVNIGDFSKDKLKLKINGNRARVIEVIPGSVVTKNTIESVCTDNDGYFMYSPDKDIAKIAVIERHNGLGNIGVGLIGGYGIKKGAIALSIAHDSHNFITVGVSDDEMYLAVKELERIGGGIAVVQNGKVIASLKHEIAGLLSAELNVKQMMEELDKIHKLAIDKLGVSKDVDPLMTLCFMALPVIPELKITDMGLFDVSAFSFTSVDV